MTGMRADMASGQAISPRAILLMNPARTMPKTLTGLLSFNMRDSKSKDG